MRGGERAAGGGEKTRVSAQSGRGVCGGRVLRKAHPLRHAARPQRRGAARRSQKSRAKKPQTLLDGCCTLPWADSARFAPKRPARACYASWTTPWRVKTASSASPAAKARSGARLTAVSCDRCSSRHAAYLDLLLALGDLHCLLLCLLAHAHDVLKKREGREETGRGGGGCSCSRRATLGNCLIDKGTLFGE